MICWQVLIEFCTSSMATTDDRKTDGNGHVIQFAYWRLWIVFLIFMRTCQWIMTLVQDNMCACACRNVGKLTMSTVRWSRVQGCVFSFLSIVSPRSVTSLWLPSLSLREESFFPGSAVNVLLVHVNILLTNRWTILVLTCTACTVISCYAFVM